MSLLRIVAIVLALVVCSPATHAEVVLKAKQWTVSIDAERLGFKGRAADGGAFVISSPRAAAARITDLKRDDPRVSWNLPDEHASVSARMDGEVLAVEFTATEVGELTWPIVSAEAKPQAYILPMFEGLHVPADDEAWAKFLAGESPMNTTAGLQMPFWGVDVGDGRTVTYVLTNPYNNELAFERTGERLGLKLTHAFTRNQPTKTFGFRIHLGDASPVTPAKIYRQHLLDTKAFVSFEEKVKKTPDAAKLLGAPHIYLWGDGLIARTDVRDYKKLAERLSADAPLGKRIVAGMSDEARKVLAAIPKTEFVDNFQKGVITEELSRVLKRRDFTDQPTDADTDDAAVARANCQAFYAAFSDVLNPPETWGDGWSVKMIHVLADAGIDRAWLGAPNWDGLTYRAETVRAAMEKGYLVGPYDSFHSIHPQGIADTWETAQFDDASLFESGAIVKADGSKRKGFKQKGHLLSPIAARPHVEARVSKLMDRFRCNSWFIDCDAFGEVFDDYAPAHPATQASDAAERVSRMKWISEKYNAVIGSEGGSAYAAPVIHFAHGVMTPVVAWGDPDVMKDRQSKFYLGGYFPPDGPAIFFKQVPMKAEHRRVYADPRFRIPLYQTVFHDSLIATHQWGYGSLKFDDPDRTRELLELLYNVPPLYHLNQAEWAKRKDAIVAHYTFFTAIHREAGAIPMTDFRRLTEARTVQQTTFGDGKLVLIANFGDEVFKDEDEAVQVAPHSIVAIGEGGASWAYPRP
jgi:hypothetical protein